MRHFFPTAPVCTVALFVLFSAAPSAAFEASYVSSQQLNLAKLLPPPPAPESNMQKADLSAVLSAQEARTEQQADRAVKDNNTSLFRIADGLFDDQFTPEKLPKVTVFYNHVIGDAVAILALTKDVWNRQRPFAVSTDVHAIGELSTNGSYPCYTRLAYRNYSGEHGARKECPNICSWARAWRKPCCSRCALSERYRRGTFERDRHRGRADAKRAVQNGLQ